jgi:hypothetical protein
VLKPAKASGKVSAEAVPLKKRRRKVVSDERLRAVEALADKILALVEEQLAEIVTTGKPKTVDQITNAIAPKLEPWRPTEREALRAAILATIDGTLGRKS